MARRSAVDAAPEPKLPPLMDQLRALPDAARDCRAQGHQWPRARKGKKVAGRELVVLKTAKNGKPTALKVTLQCGGDAYSLDTCGTIRTEYQVKVGPHWYRDGSLGYEHLRPYNLKGDRLRPDDHLDPDDRADVLIGSRFPELDMSS